VHVPPEHAWAHTPAAQDAVMEYRSLPPSAGRRRAVMAKKVFYQHLNGTGRARAGAPDLRPD
jgi:hypothetical protein